MAAERSGPEQLALGVGEMMVAKSHVHAGAQPLNLFDPVDDGFCQRQAQARLARNAPGDLYPDLYPS